VKTTDKEVVTLRIAAAMIDGLGVNYINAVKALALVAYKTIVKPFCDQHNLQFTSGMGVYCLQRVDEPPYPNNITNSDWDTYIDDDYASLIRNGYDDYADKKPPEGYADVRALLDMTTFQGDLFEFMHDYTPGEVIDDA
jgi:hypothetical protein